MICAVKMMRGSITKRLLCSVGVAKRSFFLYTFLFEQINYNYIQKVNLTAILNIITACFVIALLQDHKY